MAFKEVQRFDKRRLVFSAETEVAAGKLFGGMQITAQIETAEPA